MRAGRPRSEACSFREGDVDAAVLPALVLDLADHDRADLGGVADGFPVQANDNS
jgi:hypothetical protein